MKLELSRGTANFEWLTSEPVLWVDISFSTGPQTAAVVAEIYGSDELGLFIGVQSNPFVEEAGRIPLFPFLDALRKALADRGVEMSYRKIDG